MQKTTVVIIGSGFGGQAAAINLLKRGITDFLILERRSFMGGTWSQNTYPGAAVDVQSPLYSLSMEPYKWTQMFAGQDELREYTNYVLDKYKLREKTILNAQVTDLIWNDDQCVWTVKTESAGDFEAQFVVGAPGPLSNPVIPPFKGKEKFKGTSFHTNNWDMNYDYRGKRVAVIGSGASAAQVIPAIAPDVAHLDVFQRSPHWVLPRPDRDFSEFERTLLGIKPLHKALRIGIYWSLETRVIGFKYSKKLLTQFAQKTALEYINRKVKDPVLRKKVTPDYTIGCKRIIMSSTLYPALSRSNVTLHDKTDAIAEITETGIITAQGNKIDLDLIVYSTGYDAADGNVGFNITGKKGKPIGEFWNEFPRAYLGTTIPEFPNLFIIVGPNTGIGHTSAVFIIEAQMDYIMNCIMAVKKAKARSIEPTAKAEDDYTRHIHKEMDKTVWQTGGCNSWYKSKTGKVIAMYPGFSFSYKRDTNNFKPKDHLIA